MYLTNSVAKKGINDFTLKIIALILMTVDHIHQFFSSNGIPIWFTWIGRLSAPLFFFTMAEGFFYTRNRVTYVKRLYFFSVVMSLGKLIAWEISISDRSFPTVYNNIFETFFLVAFNILIFEFLRGRNEEFYKKVFVIFIVIVCEIILPIGVYKFVSSKIISKFILSFLPCPLLCEGNFIFVVLGITFFYLRDNHKEMMLIYLIFSLSFLPYLNFSFKEAFYHNYQWMMIFAAPLMMLYNGKKGCGLKYLFYIYYPVHIFIFFFIVGLIT
ncbi:MULTISPECIES: TraX family protein [unclassified Clostridium]|uniref:TraX family protein n=1 Tax=unclassified Clostridium TaxID=2614128 RepID=UPI0002975C7A|nr:MULTISPECIES: TraX family protein [unclassified Clostridium]EKQ51699.1 MAG: TraX protein [Clostridium sp. Maddingley MBC34-26]